MQSVGSSGNKSCGEKGSEIDTGSWMVNQETKARGWRDSGLCTIVLFVEGPIGIGTVGLFNTDLSRSPSSLRNSIGWCCSPEAICSEEPENKCFSGYLSII